MPDTAAGPSNSHQVMRNVTISPVRINELWYDEASDETCMEVMEHVENTGLCDDEGKIFLILLK